MFPRPRHNPHLLLAALLVVSAVRIAHAEPGLGDPLARELKGRGDAAMLSLRYEEALGAYERATEIEPHPSLLFNRARALQALGRYPEALDHFEAFRDQAPPELLARAGRLDELIARLRQQVGTLHIACNVKGAMVLVRGVSMGITPLEKPLRVKSGPATIKVQADGYLPYQQEIEVRGAQEEHHAVRLIARPSRGQLTVRSPTMGAVAYADGTRLGTVPAEVALTAGRHRVRVEHPDYRAAETTVELRPGESKTFAIVLEKRPGIFSQWWFWTGVSVIVVGGVGAAVALTTERKPTSGDIPPGTVSVPLIRF